MSAQHTPGPWGWGKHALWGAETGATHQGKTCLECGHAPYECGPPVLGVACEGLNDDGEDWTPSDADARLIAAAPDLLEALREADRLYSTYGLQANAAACGPWINAARAAIAKATGGAA
ncbi:MAG: hypothetical protein RJA36_36 [Pseudomonadota bacterium]